LKITAQGLAFLKNKSDLQLRQHIAGKSKKRDRRPTLPSTSEPLNEPDHALFAAMKAKRLDLARAQNVPPYVIFHDKVLLELAARRPSSLAAMSQVSGIGQSKLERYGPDFLAVISQHEINQLLTEADSELSAD
jgi:ATP-dependent DNA helicase RecQ